VSRVIRLGTFYPEDLNLNGDQANLLVLKKRLEWRGVDSEIVPVTGSSELQSVDALLLGHGSVAAWNSLLAADAKLVESAVDFMKSGKPLIAIASGYLKVLDALGEKYSIGEHVSEFVDVEGVVGYVNSPAKPNLLEWRDASLLTMLHGPVFAKNPDLADQLITKNSWADLSVANSNLKKVDELAEASRKTAFEH
jgi:CobQ-like glutamine amidotransferase family enzyme